MRPVIRTSMTLLVSKILMDLTDLIVNPVPLFAPYRTGHKYHDCALDTCATTSGRGMQGNSTLLIRFTPSELSLEHFFQHLPSGAPNRTTNSVLQNVKNKVCSSNYPSEIYLRQRRFLQRVVQLRSCRQLPYQNFNVTPLATIFHILQPYEHMQSQTQL